MESGNDLITDFEMGAGGDTLDLKDILVGFDPATSNLGSYLRIEESSGSTTFFVNNYGTGPASSPIATLLGITNVVIDDMISQGNLVIA